MVKYGEVTENGARQHEKPDGNRKLRIETGAQ